jgi:hypothetical protein
VAATIGCVQRQPAARDTATNPRRLHLEPVEADQRAGHEHKGDEPPRVAVPPHL